MLVRERKTSTQQQTNLLSVIVFDNCVVNSRENRYLYKGIYIKKKSITETEIT